MQVCISSPAYLPPVVAGGGGGPVEFSAFTETTPETSGDGIHSGTHTASGSNRYVLVFVHYVRNTQAGAGTCTYDGNSMGAALANAEVGSSRCVAIFGLVNPPTTSNAVVTSTLADGEAFGHHLKIISFTGVNQSTPVGTAVTNTGTGTDPATVNVGSVTADDLVVDGVTLQTAGGMTVDGSQTQRGTTVNISGSGVLAGCSTEDSSGTVTMSWAASGNDDWAIAAIRVISA